MINKLEAHFASSGGSICVCYIYFRYSDASELTVRKILEILVKQTLERHSDCGSLAEEAYARHLHEKTEPTEAELLQLLQQFAKKRQATFYILDALDEAPDELRLYLVKKLASLDVRLFITSRQLPDVKSCVSGVHSISIAAQRPDVELHIKQEIERSSNLQNMIRRVGPSLQDEIVSSIKDKCDGM